MANEKKRYQQTTYGNVAYDLNYQRNVVPVPDGGEPSRQPQPRKHTRTGTRQRRRVMTRPKVKLRPREAVTPTAVVGFALVVLFSYVKLNNVYASTVALQNQLTTLQTEENTLKAEYEEVFNQDVLSKAVKKAGNLKPVTSDQIVYVELSDPDNIVVYEQEEKSGGIAAFFQSVRDFFDLGKS